MTTEPTDAERIRRLPWLYAHSGGNSVFSVLTWFGPVFVLFLSELGLPKTRIGVLLSFLPFAGVMALFIAPAVARAGVKRVFLICWGTRKLVTAGLLLTPWVAARHGADGAFLYIAGLMVVFAGLRAVGETAIYPWSQEMVPPAMRGRVHGINNVVTLLCSSAALLTASRILEWGDGLDRFLVLIAIGVVGGLFCVGCSTRIPGGAPGRLRETAHARAVREALADPRLRLYLAYTALSLLTMQSVFTAFVPLFMKEQVGLPGSRVVLLEVASSVVGVLSSYIWGWWSDRRGSRPLLLVMALLACLPLLWMMIPRQHPLSFAAAIGVACLAGIAITGWWIADQRLLYVEIVPPERRTEYMALYYAWIGLVGGCGPLIAGATLDHLQGLRGQLGPLPIDPFTPLFAASTTILLVATLLLRRLQRLSGSAAAPGAGTRHDRREP